MRPNVGRARTRACLVGLAIAATACGERPTPGETAVVPLRTRWPVVSAIALVDSGPLAPAKIETSDGWIVITRLDFSDDYRDRYSHPRMFITPAQAGRWVQRIRATVDSTSPSSAPRDTTALPVLGRGATWVYGKRMSGGGEPAVSRLDFTMCDTYGGFSSVDDRMLLRIAGVFEAAARLASANTPVPRPPTLNRPYFASEVGCPAIPRLENVRPSYPDLPVGVPRLAHEVGVRVIVDTSGQVESHSIEVLPDTPDIFADAARRLVAHWRFSPPRIGEWPVRQVAHIVLSFDPDIRPDREVMFESLGSRPEPRLFFDAAPDGRVRITHGSQEPDGSLKGMREWFEPELLRSWVQRVDSLLADDAVHPRIWRQPLTGYPGVGEGYFPGGGTLAAMYPGAVFARDSVSRPDTVLHLRAQLAGCTSTYYWGERIDTSFLRRVRRAIVIAKGNEPSPAPIPDRVYDANEVACAVRLAKVEVHDPRFPYVRVMPRLGPYPAMMRAENARSEVMASFIVDTIGRAEVGSLVAMPGSDRRAVAALQQEIDTFVFSHATRGGKRVRQRVVQTWVFAPPPRCVNEMASLECEHTYSKEKR